MIIGKEVILMSAVARDQAFIVKEKKNGKPIPPITKEQLKSIKADAAKYPYKK